MKALRQITRMTFACIAPARTTLAASFIGLTVMTTPACVHKVDVQQGNIIDTEKVAKLELGMSQQQVSQLLGTPMLTDPFHTDRWDYYTWSKKGHKETISQNQLSLIFENGILTEIK